MADVAPMLPFAPALVRLNESRIKLEDVNSQQAAGVLMDVVKQVAQIRARLEAGIAAHHPVPTR